MDRVRFTRAGPTGRFLTPRDPPNARTARTVLGLVRAPNEPIQKHVHQLGCLLEQICRDVRLEPQLFFLRQ